MSDQTDKDNADANGDNGLGGAVDALDGAQPNPAATTGDKDKFQSDKDSIEDDLDLAMEDINAGRIRDADRRMRKARKTLARNKAFKDTDVTAINGKLDHAKKAKRKITQPAQVAPPAAKDLLLLLGLLDGLDGSDLVNLPLFLERAGALSLPLNMPVLPLNTSGPPVG